MSSYARAVGRLLVTVCVSSVGALGCAGHDPTPVGTQRAFLTPPGYGCSEEYDMRDEPFGDRCLVHPRDPSEHHETGTAILRGRRGVVRVPYEVIDGLAVADGDMILPLAVHPRASGAGVRAKAAGKYEEAEGLVEGWGDCTVPYEIDPDFAHPDWVRSAMDMWEAHTCIRFVEHTDEDDYVTFRTGTGCSATTGRKGGEQFVNLADRCGVGGTAHEIGHTVGLWHEQSRADRDDYIRIHLENVSEGHERNFLTYAERDLPGVDYGAWNPDSIMNYNSFKFSKNGKPTMTRLDGSTFKSQRKVFTPEDLLAIETMYRAAD